MQSGLTDTKENRISVFDTVADYTQPMSRVLCECVENEIIKEMYSLFDIKQIHNFAIKWGSKFQDRNTYYVELVDHFIADECVALGFEMDCGNAFERKYGRAVYDYNELNKIIDNITDVSLLGSAIYSRWRYFNHWAYSGTEILEPENRKWFILALDRLATLTK